MALYLSHTVLLEKKKETFFGVAVVLCTGLRAHFLGILDTFSMTLGSKSINMVQTFTIASSNFSLLHTD